MHSSEQGLRASPWLARELRSSYTAPPSSPLLRKKIICHVRPTAGVADSWCEAAVGHAVDLINSPLAVGSGASGPLPRRSGKRSSALFFNAPPSSMVCLSVSLSLSLSVSLSVCRLVCLWPLGERWAGKLRQRKGAVQAFPRKGLPHTRARPQPQVPRVSGKEQTRQAWHGARGEKGVKPKFSNAM